jgi:hypothetical protein
MVYVAVVADKCPTLDSLMRGEMSESLAGEAKWKDMGKGTFLRFIEFAYTRDYSILQSRIVKASDQHLEQDLYTEMVKEDGMPQKVFPPPPEHWVNWRVQYLLRRRTRSEEQRARHRNGEGVQLGESRIDSSAVGSMLRRIVHGPFPHRKPEDGYRADQ